MRPVLAILLALFFAVLFIPALLVSRVVNTAGDPDEIASLIDRAEVYDLVYDRFLDAALTDVTAKGLTVGSEGSETLQFEDPARAQVAIKGFVETVLPREYVKLKVEQTLDGVIPYMSGRSDSFEIDLETEDRINAVPEAVRIAIERIGLGELIVTELIVPTVRDLSDSVTGSALGIELSQDEAEEAALRIFPPEWIETQIISFTEQASPYLAGTDDDLNILVTFRDRVPVAGQVLKDKLNDEDTLSRLVFDQAVGPLVADLISENSVLVFGIEITPGDIQEAVAIVAPEEWVRSQGDGVIDAIVAWLVGATDTLEYTFDLSERKTEMKAPLEELAMRKLNDEVDVTPVCQDAAQASVAVSNALGGVFPSCLPSNADGMIEVMRPLISDAISSMVEQSLPDEITYSDTALRAQLGEESLETLDNLRETVIEGISFTDEDFVGQFADNNDPQSVANARETLDVVRAGFVLNETEITNRMDESQVARFDEVRGWIGTGWNFRWLIFLPALLLLLAVAFVGGRGWQGRAKWAGASVVIVTIVFIVATQVGWASTASLRESAIPEGNLSAENEASFPTVAAALNGGDLQIMVERVGSAWISSLTMSTLPWVAAGLILLAIGLLYPKAQRRLSASMGGPGGSRTRSYAIGDDPVAYGVSDGNTTVVPVPQEDGAGESGEESRPGRAA